MSEIRTEELVSFMNRERDTEPNPRRDEIIDAIIDRIKGAESLPEILDGVKTLNALVEKARRP
jgi:hypothetical protein